MKKIYLLMTIIMVSSLFAEVINLEQAIQMGFENSKILKRSKINVENSEKLKKSYRTNFLPKISFSANYMLRENATEIDIDGGYLPTFSPDANGVLKPNLLLGTDGNPIMGSDGTPVFSSYAYMPDINAELLPKTGLTAGLTLKQPLYMGGKIASAYKISTFGQSITELQLQQTSEELIIDISQAYWQVLAVKANLETAREYSTMLENLVKDVSNAVNSGLRTKNDLLKAQVKYNEINLMVMKAEHGLELSKMVLAQKIGLDNQTFELEEIQSTNELDESLLEKIENRTDYQILKKAVNISKEKIKIARADFLPEIGISAGYTYMEYDLNDEIHESCDYTILANLSVPIFEWFDSFYKVGIAKNEHKSSEINFSHYKEMMEIDIRKSRFDLEDALVAFNISTLSLEQAEENLRIVQNSFDADRETLTELLDAQASWQKVKTDLIEAEKEVELTRLNYKKSVGELIQD